MKTIIIKLTAVILFQTLAFVLSAQNTATINDGWWDLNSNWTNNVPGHNDKASISNAMILNTDLNLSGTTEYIIDNGSIEDPNGGSKYTIKVSNNATIDMGGNVTIEKDFKSSNNAIVTLRGCDTLRIGGDANFSNNTILTIESCAVMIIEGDMKLTNNNQTIIDGNIIVKGDLKSTNNSTVSGLGYLQVAGEVEIKNSSTIFGSSTACNSGPCNYGTGTPLPIRLLSFSAAYKQSNLIEVNWATASEINNSFFTIEISSDAINFKEIAKVEGAGNSSAIINYSKSISALYEGINYIRLKQTDYNGESETFQIVAVAPTNIYNIETEIFPNPGNGREVKVKLHKPYTGYYQIDVIGMDGKNYNSEQIYIDSDYGVYNFRMFFNTPLSSGIYLIKISSEYTQEVRKYIIR